MCVSESLFCSSRCKVLSENSKVEIRGLTIFRHECRLLRNLCISPNPYLMLYVFKWVLIVLRSNKCENKEYHLVLSVLLRIEKYNEKER